MPRTIEESHLDATNWIKHYQTGYARMNRLLQVMAHISLNRYIYDDIAQAHDDIDALKLWITQAEDELVRIVCKDEPPEEV